MYPRRYDRLKVSKVARKEHLQNSIAATNVFKVKTSGTSTGPLNALLRLHVLPINVVVFSPISQRRWEVSS